jgi:hypothetical protein
MKNAPLRFWNQIPHPSDEIEKQRLNPISFLKDGSTGSFLPGEKVGKRFWLDRQTPRIKRAL